jgi:phosphoribosylamine--glycine ligase
VTPKSSDPQSYLDVATAVNADLTVVGPEAPLVAGIVDLFQNNKRPILGPSASAARLEGSKIFSKQVMERASVPSARFIAVDSQTAARDALRRFTYPLVLKADGLAAGKGVVIVHDTAEAEHTLEALLTGRLVGSAGSRLVIEEFLAGEEVSFIALCDGRRVLPLEPSQDHKTVYDGDRGPNTGGMGAYCDSRILAAKDRQAILDRVILPVIDQMRAEGCPFRGFLYAGLMMTADGPKVLEFNVRLGDPETQALLHRLDGDIAPILAAAAGGSLGNDQLNWRPEPSVCVVLAAAGYPGTPKSGDSIMGIQEAEATGATVFQAGTKLTNGELQTAGGRVLGVTASGQDLQSAMDHAYQAVEKIRFEGMHFRKDIGRKGLKRW